MTNQYFSAIKEATRNLFRKPNTSMFPAEHVEVPPDLRGAPRLNPENCTLCLRCERVCPTTAITIDRIDKEHAKFTIDLGKCCYCKECEDACNFDAIHLKTDWLTSELDRKNLKSEHFVSKEG